MIYNVPKNIVVYLIILSFCGCYTVPLSEYNYSIALPSSIEVNEALVLDVATNLAQGTGLVQTSTSRDQGSVLITLEPRSRPVRVWLIVKSVAGRQALYVDVRGDIESQEGKDIARAVEEVFAKKYPTMKLTPYVAYRSCIGP